MKRVCSILSLFVSLTAFQIQGQADDSINKTDQRAVKDFLVGEQVSGKKMPEWLKPQQNILSAALGAFRPTSLGKEPIATYWYLSQDKKKLRVTKVFDEVPKIRLRPALGQDLPIQVYLGKWDGNETWRFIEVELTRGWPFDEETQRHKP